MSESTTTFVGPLSVGEPWWPMTQAQQIAAIWRETWWRQHQRRVLSDNKWHRFEAWNDGDAVHCYVDCEPVTPA